MSLSSEPKNAILKLYTESFKDFKNYFFKVSITKLGRPFFFNEDGSSRFPLYWTRNPHVITSWPNEKMTDAELEALDVLTTLPRPFSSRKIINCLEHNDVDSRVFGMPFLLISSAFIVLFLTCTVFVMCRNYGEKAYT